MNAQLEFKIDPSKALTARMVEDIKTIGVTQSIYCLAYAIDSRNKEIEIEMKRFSATDESKGYKDRELLAKSLTEIARMAEELVAMKVEASHESQSFVSHQEKARRRTILAHTMLDLACIKVS